MSHPARDPRSGIDGKAIAAGRRLHGGSVVGVVSEATASA
jgi:hypothetical protein